MSSSIYKIKSPANGSVLGEIEYFQEKDIPVYVDKARKALRSWRYSVPHERAKILKKASRKLISIKKELEILHSKESGKILTQSKKEILGHQIFLKPMLILEFLNQVKLLQLEHYQTGKEI